MKRIIAIVRPGVLESLKDALLSSGLAGMTVYEVYGCGSQRGWSEYFRGSETLINMLPKVKFELVVADSEAQATVDLIMNAARTGEVGDGKVFVEPVEQVVRIRTGESGDAAV